MAKRRRVMGKDFDYQSSPLNGSSSIRIVELQPASKFADPLLCDIVPIARLEGSTPFTPDAEEGYEAVSYTWGAPDFSNVLECKGGSSLKITPNVETMLRYLRKRFGPRRLWIDALSINQQDDYEKSNQVAIMGDIFGQADKVCIWLGEEEENDRGLFNIFHAIGDWKTKDLDRERETLERLLHEAFGSTSEAPLENFFAKPWFLRRWIIQEVIRSKRAKIRCGRLKIEWPVFVRALGVLKNQPHIKCTGLDTARAMCWVHPETIDGADLLVMFRASQCSEVKDRLFAFNGMLSHGDTLEGTTGQFYASFKPDYTTSWKEISTRFATVIAEDKARKFRYRKYKKRYILDLALTFKHTPDDQNWPSWVPDWSVAPNEDILRDASDLDMSYKSKVFHLGAFTALELSGLSVETLREEIMWVSDPLNAQSTPYHIIETVMSWLQFLANIISSLEKIETMRKLFGAIACSQYEDAKDEAYLFLEAFFSLISGGYGINFNITRKFLEAGNRITNKGDFFLGSLKLFEERDADRVLKGKSNSQVYSNRQRVMMRLKVDLDPNVLDICEQIRRTSQGCAFFLCRDVMGLCPLETRVGAGDHILRRSLNIPSLGFVVRPIDIKDIDTDFHRENTSHPSRDMQIYRLVGVCKSIQVGTTHMFRDMFCTLLDPDCRFHIRGRPELDKCVII
ncbi:MAG: hypothetical protein M1822_005918 [Bathelium mastoideum]|nr:MAG: hypothetical protein M1822_005918 [Bathelium mastoideum]